MVEGFRLIDLTHPIHPSMPVYPGTEPPVFQQANTLEKDGFAEKRLSLFTHTGTHMDAPAHIMPEGRTLDSYEASHFVGPARVIDLGYRADQRILPEDLHPLAEELEQLDFLIFRTGWSAHWGSSRYFRGFPTLTVEAAEWLVRFDLKGAGIDAISFDPVDDPTLPVHQTLLGADWVLVENLTHLDRLSKNQFTFSCLPLHLADADGSPIRAVAYEEADAISAKHTCPLCGGNNDCQADNPDGCWCQNLTVPQSLLDQIPEGEKGQSCICRDCILKYKNQPT